MANQNPRKENLVRQKPSWNNLPTKSVRIPGVFETQVIEYARSLDRGEKPQANSLNPELEKAKQKIEDLQAEIEFLQAEIEGFVDENESLKNQLPDLYAVREKVISKWQFKKNESCQRIREFADAFIAAILSGYKYTMHQRLLDELNEERKRRYASDKLVSDWHDRYLLAKNELAKRGVKW